MQRRVYEEYGGVGSVVNDSPYGTKAKESQNQVYAKIFGWFGLGLLITAATSFLVAGILAYFLGQADYSAEASETAYRTFSIYLGLLIGSFIFMLILSFVINWRIARGGARLLVPYILYSILMGVFVSSFLVAGVPFYTMGEAFGITAVVFIVMGTIGYFSKRNLNWMGMVFGGLLITMMISGLVFWLIFLIVPALFSLWSLMMSLLITIFVVVVVAIDMQNIKGAINSGASGRSFEIMCALTCYIDFMQIFIRVLYLLMILSGNSRKN